MASRPHGQAFLDAAIADRAVRWSWRVHGRGVVFEIAVRTERIRDEFRGRQSIKAALDAMPDPRYGLAIAPGGGDWHLSRRRDGGSRTQAIVTTQPVMADQARSAGGCPLVAVCLRVVAGDRVVGVAGHEGRFLGAAPVLGPPAAGVEPAAGGWV